MVSVDCNHCYSSISDLFSYELEFHVKKYWKESKTRSSITLEGEESYFAYVSKADGREDGEMYHIMNSNPNFEFTKKL